MEVPAGGAEGMLLTSGGRFGGYGFYLLKGKPVFLWNLVDLKRIRWEGPDALAPGKHTIEFDFKYDGLGAGTLAFNNMSGIGQQRHGRAEGRRKGSRHARRWSTRSRSSCNGTKPSTSVPTPARRVDDKDYQVPFHVHRQAQQADAQAGPAAADARGHQEARSGAAKQQGQRIAQVAGGFGRKEVDAMKKSVLVMGPALLLIASAPQAQQGQQYPLMNMIADKIVQKYQNSTCVQLAEAKSEKPQGEEAAMKQRVIAALKADPQMRQAFIDKVAAPIANKMFECGMIRSRRRDGRGKSLRASPAARRRSGPVRPRSPRPRRPRRPGRRRRRLPGAKAAPVAAAPRCPSSPGPSRSSRPPATGSPRRNRCPSRPSGPTRSPACWDRR